MLKKLFMMMNLLILNILNDIIENQEEDEYDSNEVKISSIYIKK